MQLELIHSWHTLIIPKMFSYALELNYILNEYLCLPHVHICWLMEFIQCVQITHSHVQISKFKITNTLIIAKKKKKNTPDVESLLE